MTGPQPGDGTVGQRCTRCGIGPFVFVAERGNRAKLCFDCADVVHGKRVR